MRGLSRPREAEPAGSNGSSGLSLRGREPGASSVRAPLRTRRLLQPVPLAGVALMLIGLLVVLAYTSAATRRTPIIVVGHDLPAGATLRAADLRTTRIAADGGVLAALVPVAAEQTLIGRRLAAPVAAGEPLPRAAIANSVTAPAALTLVVPIGHALAGDLHPGDHVGILATFSNPTGAATTSVLARDVAVLAVGQAPGIGDPNQAAIPVTIALPNPRLAARLALANSTAKLDLLRESGRSAAQTIASAQSPPSVGP
jgi:Flp pilus assembly protein CpaB